MPTSSDDETLVLQTIYEWWYVGRTRVSEQRRQKVIVVPLPDYIVKAELHGRVKEFDQALDLLRAKGLLAATDERTDHGATWQLPDGRTLSTIVKPLHAPADGSLPEAWCVTVKLNGRTCLSIQNEDGPCGKVLLLAPEGMRKAEEAISASAPLNTLSIAGQARRIADRLQALPDAMSGFSNADPNPEPSVARGTLRPTEILFEFDAVRHYIECHWTPSHAMEIRRKVCLVVDGVHAFIKAMVSASAPQSGMKWDRKELATFRVTAMLVADELRRWSDNIARKEAGLTQETEVRGPEGGKAALSESMEAREQSNTMPMPSGGERPPGVPAKPKQRRANWMANAMFFVRDQPGLSDAEIARKVGVHPSQLSRCLEYQRAAAMARGQKTDLPKGEKKVDPDTGQHSFEAYD